MTLRHLQDKNDFLKSTLKKDKVYVKIDEIQFIDKNYVQRHGLFVDFRPRIKAVLTIFD